jgi:hypothetical protein
MKAISKLSCICLVFLAATIGCTPPAETYTITYDANGATIGTVPTDPTLYLEGQTVTVLGNTGALSQTYQAFRGWNTRADGAGTTYLGGTSLTLGTAHVILYAIWSDYVIGDTGPAGGLIFYDQGSIVSGWRFMEAASSDQSAGIRWNNGSIVTVSTNTSVGSGKANTDAIIAAQGTGTYAAALCKNLTLAGYSDWFLPSTGELNMVYQKLKLAGLGSFGEVQYWSSCYYGGDAEFIFFNGGATDAGPTSTGRHVRAVRSF